MKTVRIACQLQPHALSVTLGDQVEQLDELIRDEEGGEAFFERTYITEGMRTLITEGIARLAAQSSQAVFHLKQAMGGGKTHLLVGFGLLARHPKLRQAYCSDVPHINAFGSAQVAAFNGRNSPTHYFWGEIAEQLGKAEQFTSFWSGGPKAPDESDWLKLFDGDQPILILLDEMPPYFQILDTLPVGKGTVADIATRAFANMLTAALKRAHVCVVVSDLAAAYTTGSKLIYQSLEDARKELGRQERTITPVDLATNEIFDILRKRLFVSLPDQAEIEDIAAVYGSKLAEAAKAKMTSRSAEAVADEIAETYPFHPRLKNVVALFKENEEYRQTRGLIELISRLLKSVWERADDDVFLIGPQHFDLSIAQVRDKISEISGMQDVIARDLWDKQQSAHAQVIDLQSGQESASQVGALLLTASLSTAVNAVKGLTQDEMIECLVSPLREAADFAVAFEALEKAAWYLHHTVEGRYYFDKQENLTKLLQTRAKDAPQPEVDNLLRHRLETMFQPKRHTVYNAVLALPTLQEVDDQVRKERVLLIFDPDAKLPPDKLQEFFDGLTYKNRLCVLTGDKSTMAKVETAARDLYAAQKTDVTLPTTHAQRPELEKRLIDYEHAFNATILGLFDKVLFPVQFGGSPARLTFKPLDTTRDGTKPFDGEEQIVNTLTSDPLKLYLEVAPNFEGLRDRAEEMLWPQNQDEARWSDILDRYGEQAGMPWLPPKGLDELKTLACNRGLWEDLGNGYVTKKPKQKRTGVQVTVEAGPNDQGVVLLRVNPQNAGPAPRIYYAEDGPVSEQSARLEDQTFNTSALRVNFLVVDPSGTHEMGEATVWTNKLVIRNRLYEQNGQRMVEVMVAPHGALRTTLDGSSPRDGTPYETPLKIGRGRVLLRVFAQADGLEAFEEFTFGAMDKPGVTIDPVEPAKLVSKSGLGHQLDSRARAYQGLEQADQRAASLEKIYLNVGQGARMISVTVGELSVEPAFIKALLDQALEQLGPEAPVTLSFGRASFGSGHDLEAFCQALGIKLEQQDVEQ